MLQKFDKASRYYDTFMRIFGLYKTEDICEVLKLEGNEVIADIGGGTGFMAAHLSKNSKKVYVLDESEAMLSKVKAENNVITVLGDAFNTGFADGSMDVVVLTDVLHHIADQARLIKEMERILVSKGRVIVLDFEKDHLKTRFLWVFERFLFGRIYYRTSSEVRKMLENSFSIKECVEKGYYYIIEGIKK